MNDASFYQFVICVFLGALCGIWAEVRFDKKTVLKSVDDLMWKDLSPMDSSENPKLYKALVAANEKHNDSVAEAYIRGRNDKRR